jgi:hypothetical protein
VKDRAMLVFQDEPEKNVQQSRNCNVCYAVTHHLLQLNYTDEKIITAEPENYLVLRTENILKSYSSSQFYFCKGNQVNYNVQIDKGTV